MRETKTFPLTELKIQGDAGAGSFEGRASTFGTVDSYGDTIDHGAYKETIPEFLRRGFIGWSHDWANPIGIVTQAEERPDGLYVKGQFHSHPEAQTVRTIAQERAAAGKFMGLSIGYEAEDWEERKAPDGPVRNRWGEWQDKVRALTKIKLYEVSLVTVPAEANSGVTAVKQDLTIVEGFGLSFAEHTSQLRDAVENYLIRCRTGTGAEVKVGRAISAGRRARMESIGGMLLDAHSELVALLAEVNTALEEEDEAEALDDPVIGNSELPEADSLAPPELRALYQRFTEQQAFYAGARSA